MLRDIDELDTDEAARSLSLTANTIKVRLQRARQALKTSSSESLRSSRMIRGASAHAIAIAAHRSKRSFGGRLK